MNQEEGDAPGGLIAPSEILAILYRRRWWVLIPAFLGLAVGGVLALWVQPQYQSTATLLIASQQIPTSLVASPFDNYADERIAKIRQQILSRANLIGIIKDMNLYPDKRKELPSHEVENLMRGAIGVNLVSASDTNTGGEGARTTIAFSLSFLYHDPAKAQGVADRLTKMFIGEDKRLRIEQSSGTAAFLERRGNELRDRLVELSQERREIEARYAGALPNQVAVSVQSSSALRAEISRLDAETQGIMQQNSILAARSEELAAALREGPNAARSAGERLRQLRARYSDQHPDVIAARAELTAERAQTADLPESNAVIASEIAAGRDRIAALSQRRAQLVGAVGEMEHISAQAPQAAYELNILERDIDNLKQQYQDIREKQLEAQVSANLQAEGKGEHFSVVDPPNWPIDPVYPNPKHLLAVGLAGGIAAGLGLIVLLEIMAGLINGQAAIERMVGVGPLVVVPVIRPEGQGILARLKRHRTADTLTRAA